MVDSDQRRKLVFEGVFDSGTRSSWLWSDWELAPIVSLNTGHPFNVLAGGTDINGDRHSTNDRPLGFGRDTGRGPDFAEWDMRLARTIAAGEHMNVQLFAEESTSSTGRILTASTAKCLPLTGSRTFP